jgi:hypothetical protein
MFTSLLILVQTHARKNITFKFKTLPYCIATLLVNCLYSQTTELCIALTEEFQQ